MTVEHFSFKNGHNLKIVGEVWHAAKSKGLAVVQHGFSSNRTRPHIRLMTQLLHEAGYTTIAFDATHSWGDSGGKLSGATLTSHWEDFEDVLSWARLQPFYLEPFILAGHSLGGFSALHLAQKNAGKTKAVLAASPFVSGKLRIEAYHKYNPQELSEWQRNGYTVRANSRDPTITERIPYGLMEDYQRYDLLRDAGKITCPTLIVVGADDTSTPPEHHLLLREALGGPAEMVVLPDCPHTFREAQELNALENAIRPWLKAF